MIYLGNNTSNGGRMSFQVTIILLFLTTAIFIFAESYFRDHKKVDSKEQQYDQSPENYKRF